MTFMRVDEESFHQDHPTAAPAAVLGGSANHGGYNNASPATVSPGGYANGTERQDATPAVPPPNIDPTAPNPLALDLVHDLNEEIFEDIPEGVGICPGPVPVNQEPPRLQQCRPQPRPPKKNIFGRFGGTTKEKRTHVKQGRSVKVNGSQERVFTEAFVIDSVKIAQKKDIDRYIRSKTAALLKSTGRSTDDFYYAYVINSKGIVSFISTVSNRHLVGAITVFAPAFLREGRYVYQQDDTETPIYHYINNEGGKVTCERAYELRQGYERISATVALDEKLPASLIFQWSLSKSTRQFNTALAAILAIFAIAYGVSFNEFSHAKDAAMKSAAAAAQAGARPMQRGLPNVFGPIWDTAAKIGGNGIISHVALAQDAQNLTFSIQFGRNVDATGFISQNGGTVETDGSVKLNVPIKPRL